MPPFGEHGAILTQCCIITHRYVLFTAISPLRRIAVYAVCTRATYLRCRRACALLANRPAVLPAAYRRPVLAGLPNLRLTRLIRLLLHGPDALICGITTLQYLWTTSRLRYRGAYHLAGVILPAVATYCSQQHLSHAA